MGKRTNQLYQHQAGIGFGILQNTVFESPIGERADDVENRGYSNDLPLRIKLLMTLWWFDNQETFRHVANRFCTTRGNNLDATL